MTPARPPTARTSPDETTPEIHPSASSGVFSCSGMSSWSGVSCAVQIASQARVKSTNHRPPARLGTVSTWRVRDDADTGDSFIGDRTAGDPIMPHRVAAGDSKPRRHTW